MSELDPKRYGLDPNQSLESSSGILYGPDSFSSVSDVKSYLESIYCGTMAVDFSAVEVSYVKPFMAH